MSNVLEPRKTQPMHDRIKFHFACLAKWTLVSDSRYLRSRPILTNVQFAKTQPKNDPADMIAKAAAGYRALNLIASSSHRLHLAFSTAHGTIISSNEMPPC